MAEFDFKSYLDDVVVPVQTGWSPHRDYFRVYRLSLHSGQSDVTTALADLPVQWGKPELRQYARACERLHACHPQAAAVLGDPAHRARHRETVEREQQVLVEVVRHRLYGAPAMTPEHVTALLRSAAGRWSRPDVLAALDAAGAAVHAPGPLPYPAEPKRWGQLREHLADLPHGSLWEYLHGTPELRGADTTVAHAETRRQRLLARRDSAADAERSVLTLVQRWAREPGGLAAVLAHELVADLAAAAVCGYSAVRDLALPERCAAAGLLAGPDAVAYAVWAACDEASWTDYYYAAVGAHRLREALALLESRPLTEPWRRVREELRVKVSGLDAKLQLAREREADNPEDAAARYLAIGRELADPAVTNGLRRCPAAPPEAVNSTVDGADVVVAWRLSPATAGRIGYRVCRGAVVLAEEAFQPPVVDRDAPVARKLVYTVTAMRQGEPGVSASAEPVTILPEVTDLQVTAVPGVVMGKWRLPPGASRAVVRRAGSDEDVIEDEMGFVDWRVVPGRTYTYRVQAEYPAARSRGIDVRVKCPREPAGVTDLRAVAADGFVELTWTPPCGDVVEIRLLTGPEALPADMVRYGQAALTGPLVATSRIGRARVPAADLAAGRTLVPVTVSGLVAAVGSAAVLDISAARVSGLRAVRLGPQVRLSWHWPEWAGDALVVWRHGTPPVGPDDPAARTLRITRTAYLSRGVRVSAAEPGDHWFGVCVIGDGQVGPLATVGSLCPIQVRYRVDRRAWSSRRVVMVEGETELPDVVVLGQSAHRPLSPDDGVVLATLPGGLRVSQAEFTVPSDLRRPVHLRAFALDDSVWMCHPDPRDLVVR